MHDETAAALAPGVSTLDHPAHWQRHEALGDHRGCLGSVRVQEHMSIAIAGVAHHLYVQAMGGLQRLSACTALYAPSTNSTFSEGTLAQARATTAGAPSRSCTLAALTVTASSSPSVSTTRWRLRPLTFLPASKPASPPWGEYRVD